MRRSIFAILLLFSITLTAWAETTFSAKAPSAVVAGQQFRVQYTVESQSDMQPRDFRADIEGKGLNVLYGPGVSSSNQSYNINGQFSQVNKFTYTYVLSAEHEGTYTLPAATVSFDGKTLSSNSVTIKVLPPDEQPQSDNRRSQSQQSGTQTQFNKDDVHLVLDLSKTTAYEGEAIVATLKLYWRNIQMSNPSDLKLPDFEGFTVQEMENSGAQATLERYNGANYQMFPLAKWLLFPSRSGEIQISAASLCANVQIVGPARRGGFFDWPLATTQNLDVPLQSVARKVTVKALPSGRPASYMNAVGDFRVKTELTSNSVKTNDAVIYRLTVEGTGNFKYIREPQPEFPTDFEVFDPKEDVSSTPQSAGMKGRKVIEYTIIPRHAGTFTIPSLEFSYFDLAAGQYRTLTTEAHTLQVEKGAGDGSEHQGSSVDFSGTNQERLRVLGNDVRYLHALDADALQPVGQQPFYGSMAYWLCICIPLLAFIVLAIVYRRRIKRLADVAGTRTRRAGKVAERRLKAANQALKAKDETVFYESIHKAILGYVGDKLRIPLSDLSQDNILDTLQSHSASADAIQIVKEVLDTCQFARYAPSSDSHAMDDLYRRTSEVIDRLESEIR